MMSRALQNLKRRRRKRKAKGESDRLRYYIRAFNMGEVYEFRQAFIMIDQNGDFFVDQEDLKDALACLSLPSNDSVVDSMMSEVPKRRAMNFTMFLGLFGEKMIGMNSEDEIRDAFAVFDEEGTGKIHKDRLRELLTTMGDCFTDAKVDEMLREAPVDAAGNVDYVVFSHILKHGAKKEYRTRYQQQ